MKLYFIKQDYLDILKTNIESNIDCYKETTNKWIYNYFNNEYPFSEFKIECNEFELKTREFNSASEMDLYNSKVLYENLKKITDTQAGDERLWAGLTHSVFYNFVQKRWEYDEKNMGQANYIKSRYFYSEKSKGVFRNTLSKLWWIGRLTYDEKRKNKYELTDVLGNSDMATRVNDMFTSNFSRNPKIAHAFLSAIKEYEDNDIKIGKYTYRKAVQFMNAYGGMTLIDYLDEGEIKEVVISKIGKILNQKENNDKSSKMFKEGLISINNLI
ncbi:hypothetical protein FDA33_05310 [Clostridium botulinum]|nr:hypothetical protein [Clostridium botulinum]NFI16834.1 hypothetical protein [Clostridium botulinum]NFI54596.1 hypothetical protein [Clostridium botulinum]NFL91548.1 hypothetical protein [Clostridium botulinum]NFN51465.1 hypothetical protein [Clostridium botulinum]